MIWFRSKNPDFPLWTVELAFPTPRRPDCGPFYLGCRKLAGDCNFQENACRSRMARGHCRKANLRTKTYRRHCSRRRSKAWLYPRVNCGEGMGVCLSVPVLRAFSYMSISSRIFGIAVLNFLFSLLISTFFVFRSMLTNLAHFKDSVK